MIRRFSCEYVSNFYKNNSAADITLYYTTLSPPSRTVLLVAKAMGIELHLKDVDLDKGENLTPELLKVLLSIISEFRNFIFQTQINCRVNR